MTDISIWKTYGDELKAACVPSLTSDLELPELLFHYTSAESFFSIISIPMMAPQAGPRLWASCALGMNDPQEIRYGISLVHEIASQFVPKEELDRSFAQHYEHREYAKVSFLEGTCIACFCDKPDLLSQWRSYGKRSTGYGIGFRRDLLSSAGSQAGFQLVPITYERQHQIEKIQGVFDAASVILSRDHPQPEWRLWRMAADTAINLSLGFKHTCFSEEREWRLISSPNPQNLKFRGGRWGIVPYVEISLTRHCLAEIWQGPALDHDLTRRTLEMYLVRTYGVDPKGKSVVRVRRSEIPLRQLDA